MKRILIALCALLLSVMAVGGLTAMAAPIDPERPASVTVCYRYDGQVFSDVECRIFRVAEVFPDGTYALTGPFADYPVNIYGIGSQAEWRNIASTLVAYIAADGIKPDHSVTTNAEGEAVFRNVRPGLYLISSVQAELPDKLVTFETFLTALPYPSEQGEHNYDVTLYPKARTHTPTPKEIGYKVVKQWKDAGNLPHRPDTVTVDILKDGVLQSTQILSPDNNWCYRWSAPDDGSKWQAVERNVPSEYTVTVVEEGSTILITNVYQSQQDPPETGETTVLWPFLLVMSMAGGLLMILAIRHMRKEQ